MLSILTFWNYSVSVNFCSPPSWAIQTALANCYFSSGSTLTALLCPRNKHWVFSFPICLVAVLPVLLAKKNCYVLHKMLYCTVYGITYVVLTNQPAFLNCVKVQLKKLLLVSFCLTGCVEYSCWDHVFHLQVRCADLVGLLCIILGICRTCRCKKDTWVNGRGSNKHRRIIIFSNISNYFPQVYTRVRHSQRKEVGEKFNCKIMGKKDKQRK